MGAFKVLNAPVPAALQIAELKAEVKEIKDQLNRQNKKQSQKTRVLSKPKDKKIKPLLAAKVSAKSSKFHKPLKPKYEQGIARGKNEGSPQAPTPNGAAEVTKIIADMGSKAVEADPVYAPRFQRLQQLNLHQQQLLKDMLVGTAKVFNDADKKLKKPDKEQFTVEEILNLGHETDPGIQQAQLVSILRNMQRQAGDAMSHYWQRLQQRPTFAFPNANTYFVKNDVSSAPGIKPSDAAAVIKASFYKNTVKGVAKSSLKTEPLNKSRQSLSKSIVGSKKQASLPSLSSQGYHRPLSLKQHHKAVDGERRFSSSSQHQREQTTLKKKGTKEDAYADLGSVSISGMIKTRKRSSMS